MSWTVVNADQLANYYKQQGQAQNPYASAYNQANNQTPQIIQLQPQANPWDSNPPLGTTPNLVWPQNTTPFQTQGGTAPWPNYNQQSLLPQYMAGHGLPGNHPHCQPQAGAQVHTNFNIEKPSTNNNNVNNNKNNSNLNKNGHSLTTCPCCGNMTYRANIKPDYNTKTLSSSGEGTSHADQQSQYTSGGTSYTDYDLSLYNSMSSQPHNNNAKPCPVHGSTAGISGSQNSQHNNYTKYMQDQMNAYQQSLMSAMNSRGTGTQDIPRTSGAHNQNNQYADTSNNSRGIIGNPQTMNQGTINSTSASSAPSANAGIQQQGVNKNQMVANAYQQSMDNWNKAKQLHENIQRLQAMQHQQQYYGQGQQEQQQMQGGNKQSNKKGRSQSQASTLSKDTDVNSFSSL